MMNRISSLLSGFAPPPKLPKIDKSTFLLWEPCSQSHGEIIPGYADYLLQLGFNVIILMTPDRIDEGLFTRFTHPKLTIGTLTQRQIKKFMRGPQPHDAAGILITTAGKLAKNADGSANLKSVFGAIIPAKVLLVEHDARALIDGGGWDPRLITLCALNAQGASSAIVNPHIFGTVKKTPKTDGKTVFLMVGAAQAKRRNQNLVFDAAVKLLAEGRRDFEIRLIGKSKELSIPEPLHPHITLLGRLDFSDLYSEVEACDFIVTAFQKDNTYHAPYKTVKTSGSFQLCYGFAKPCIVQEQFAAQTFLDAHNSLLYDIDDQMFDAMARAVAMSAADYAQMQEALARDAATLYQHSLTHLKALIDA